MGQCCFRCISRDVVLLRGELRLSIALSGLFQEQGEDGSESGNAGRCAVG
jgi:hypothetical protein